MMRDQLKEPPLTDKEKDLVFKVLKQNGFTDTIGEPHIHTNGEKSVTITDSGYNWREGGYTEWDLTTHSILKKIRNKPRAKRKKK